MVNGECLLVGRQGQYTGDLLFTSDLRIAIGNTIDEAMITIVAGERCYLSARTRSAIQAHQLITARYFIKKRLIYSDLAGTQNNHFHFLRSPG